MQETCLQICLNQVLYMKYLLSVTVVLVLVDEDEL